MAALEGITLEAAWNLNIVQSFNGLSYLKAKEKHDKEVLQERARKSRMQL